MACGCKGIVLKSNPPLATRPQQAAEAQNMIGARPVMLLPSPLGAMQNRAFAQGLANVQGSFAQFLHCTQAD